MIVKQLIVPHNRGKPRMYHICDIRGKPPLRGTLNHSNMVDIGKGFIVKCKQSFDIHEVAYVDRQPYIKAITRVRGWPRSTTRSPRSPNDSYSLGWGQPHDTEHIISGNRSLLYLRNTKIG